MIDKQINKILDKAMLESLIIKNLIEAFMWNRINTQEEVSIPLPISAYRKCLLENQASFYCYTVKHRIGFIDELDSVILLWEYRGYLEKTFKPSEKVEFLIALRMFMKWCYQQGVLNQEIVDNMQLAKDNRMYVSDMDPCNIDLFDIF
jgi:hypothetical protein